jgi:hypothetical protein
MPVHASEPNSSIVRRADFPLNPSMRNSSTKRRAAIIGPTVCELDGPIPILNKSSALINEFSRSVQVRRRRRPVHGALIR